MWGSRGAWRSQLNAAGCSLAPCSAAWLQAAWCTPDLQARWGSSLNPILMTGMMKHRVLFPNPICLPCKISIMFYRTLTCAGYPDHMVFSEFRRRFDVLAPHLTKKHGRNYIVKDEKRVSQSVREQQKNAQHCLCPSIAKINVVRRQLHYICPWFVSSQLTEE